MDLDRISDGRFVLGLGSSIPSCTTGMYGAPSFKPLGHLRDTVKAVRYIIANAHKGLDPYEGEYFKTDFAEMMVTAPPDRKSTRLNSSHQCSSLMTSSACEKKQTTICTEVIE